MTIRSLSLVLFLLYLVLGERVVIGRSPGFAGVPVLEILFAVSAVAAWVSAGRPRPRLPGAWIGTVGPLFFLLLAMPLTGVLLGTYQLTSLYSWMIVLVPLAVLALTLAVRHRILPVVHAAIVVHGLYALGQTSLRLGLLPVSVWGPLQTWDAEVQRSMSEAYVIYGRSTGLFINANTFALWSLTALLLSHYFLSGARRSTGIAFAIIGILGSQSRTGIVCLAVLVLLWALRTLRDSDRLSRQVVRIAVFILPVLLVGYAFGILQRLFEAALVSRVTDGLSVLSDGVRADSNLLGRVEAWRMALDYSPSDPRLSFGTLGPPQVQFVHFIDNQFVSFYLQGGVLLVAAFLLALLSPVLLSRRGVRPISPVVAASAVLAITSLTLTPMHDMQATCLVWVIVGLTLDRSLAEHGGAGRRSGRPVQGQLLLRHP
ncbi:MAG: hypothetical protein GX555_17355 [Actinomycetales bacterium]|nr:hypothetical protein [Actinomycetales bacterium]